MTVETVEPIENVLADSMLAIMRENMPTNAEPYRESSMLWGHIWKEMRTKAAQITNPDVAPKIGPDLTISDELIINAVDAADIGYWARVALGADTAKMLKSEATAIIFEKDGPHTGKGDGRHELTGEKIRAALKIIAEKYPHHLSSITEDNADCETGDVIIQCALFGEIVYG